MGSDWTAPPIPTPAALVGLGEDEYEILSHIAQKMTHGALKEKKKAAAGAIPAAEEEKDRDFFAVLGASIVKMVRGLPAWFVKNWIPLAVMFGVWVLIQLVLANLLNIGFVKMVVFFLGALTASFGNFLGKTVFAVFLFGTALPLYRYYKQSGAKDLFAKYRKVRQMLRHALEGLGKRAWKVVPASAGVGLLVANLLTTDNSLNTSLVCLLGAISLLNAFAFGFDGSIRDKLFRAAYRDVSGWFGKRRAPSLEMSHAVFGSFAAGLGGSVVPTVLLTPFTFVKYLTGGYIPAWLSGFQGVSGYVFGALFVVAAVVLHFLLAEKPAKPTGAAAPDASK